MTETTTERVHPFSNGTQFGDWCANNCARCTKSSDDASKCDLEMALATAYMTDGTIGQAEATRIGYKDDAYTWRCGEWSWDGTVPPKPPTALQRLESELGSITEKVNEMLERARENADWPEDAAPWPAGPWGDELCDLALVSTWVNAAQDLLKEHAKAASGRIQPQES